MAVLGSPRSPQEHQVCGWAVALAVRALFGAELRLQRRLEPFGKNSGLGHEKSEAPEEPQLANRAVLAAWCSGVL